MALDLIVRQIDTVLENEGQYGDHEAVQEEVCEQANAYGTDDEEGTGSPFETDWLGFSHVCRFEGVDEYFVFSFVRGAHRLLFYCGVTSRPRRKNEK